MKVLTKVDEWSLSTAEVTLAERLTDAGYSSHMLGKCELFSIKEPEPNSIMMALL